MKNMYGIDSMPETAENLADAFGISRVDQDRFSQRSQQKAETATNNGFFKEKIVSVTIKQRRGDPLIVSSDEHIRPGTTIDQLAKLPTPFRENGSVTAGNSSGINDGACALLIASEKIAHTSGLSPRARIVSIASAGVEPKIMGIGPVPAINKVLRNSSLSLAQMDVIELNEAFAVQALAVLRKLELEDNDSRVNQKW